MSEEVPNGSTDPKCEEFDCPPGRITVDIEEGQSHSGRGIHIYYFDPEVGDANTIDEAITPSKKQWHHVKEKVLQWLDDNLDV